MIYDNFFDISKVILGELPVQFQFLYAITAFVLTLAFFYIIFAFITGFMRKLSRW